MSEKFRLDIISLTRLAHSGKVISVTVPGAEGELTILAHHIPLITPLRAGEMTIRAEEGGEEIIIAISSGFLIIDPNHVTILADSAEKLEELDEKKIEAAKERAEKLLTEKQFADDRSFADAIATLEKSSAHLRILKKHRTHHKGSVPSTDD